MSARRDEKWLDEQLQRAVNGPTPVFDAQAWKQKYADAYDALVARGRQKTLWGKRDPKRERFAFGSPTHLTLRIVQSSFGRLAIAAVILVVAGVFVAGRFAGTQPTLVPQPAAQQSPAQMVSMISLATAFQQGGMEGLDKQCDRALEKLGPRPSNVSMRELLKDINSKG